MDVVDDNGPDEGSDAPSSAKALDVGRIPRVDASLELGSDKVIAPTLALWIWEIGAMPRVDAEELVRVCEGKF